MTENSATWFAFLGLTVIVGLLVAVLGFALLRFAAAARDSRRNLRETRLESVLLSSALEDAITKLKAQERATAARAEASERLSGLIVDSLTAGLLVVDAEGALRIVNPAARRILALEDATLPGDFRDALAPTSELVTVIEESLRTKEPVVRRTISLERPGGLTHLGVSVSPLSGEGGASGAICLFTDLTSVVALEEQLRLKETLARLGELTAGLAHEFRNGLATIHGYGRLLDPAALPEQYRPYIHGIRSETQALGDIVTNFLRFARPEPLALAPVDLKELVERAAEDVPQATVNIHGEFGTIEADGVLLRQAVSNLLRNSVEACASRAIPPRIEMLGTTDSAAGTVQLDVRDHGPGIDPAALPRVFQPFFTLRHGGTGLGLAIVQKIVVSHNGTIVAANHPDGGAVFRITLPLVGT